MQAGKAQTLDEKITTDPTLHAEFVLYVYYQYNEELTGEVVASSLGAILEGREKGAPEGSLESALSSSLLGRPGNRFAREDALKRLAKLKLDVEMARREGHDFLNEMVIRDYHIFEAYLIGAYHEFMNTTSSLASVHNYLDAEMEVYRATCFCFPGLRRHADEVFSRIFRSAEGGERDEDSVRRVEFLQWFVTQYVIPAVDMVAAEWYYTRLRRYLNRRVLPIFKDVANQRRSVFIVSSRSKNSVTLEDLLYAEHFSVKMSDADALERGSMIECTLVRYASSNRINSIVRLIEREEADRVASDITARRGLMSEMHDRFVAAHGSEALLLGSTQEVLARYNEFVAGFTEEKGLKDKGMPRLVNAEAFNAHPEFRAALLCEQNNFYLSIYYPLLMDAIEGKIGGGSASEIADICLSNAMAIPFTSLRRIFVQHGRRLLELESAIHPELSGIDSLKSLILRERGHSWDYTPLPLVAGSEPLGMTPARG